LLSDRRSHRHADGQSNEPRRRLAHDPAPCRRAGTRSRIGCHTFRATGITTYLEAGGTLENAQAMAAHESPRTTKLYDRTDDAITLDEVELITI
jgi:integrase